MIIVSNHFKIFTDFQMADQDVDIDEEDETDDFFDAEFSKLSSVTDEVCVNFSHCIHF